MWNIVFKKAQARATEWDGNWTEYTNTAAEKKSASQNGQRRLPGQLFRVESQKKALDS